MVGLRGAVLRGGEAFTRGRALGEITRQSQHWREISVR